jgi:hypothetical protein
MLVCLAISNTGTFANRQYRTADLARRNLLFVVVWQGRRAIRLGVLPMAARKECARPAGAIFSTSPHWRRTESVYELLRVRLLLEAVRETTGRRD